MTKFVKLAGDSLDIRTLILSSAIFLRYRVKLRLHKKTTMERAMLTCSLVIVSVLTS